MIGRLHPVKEHKTFNENYDQLTYRASTHDLTEGYKKKNPGVSGIKRDLVIDSFIMHYKNWENLSFDPFSTSSWSRVLQKYYQTDQYKKLNRKVSSDPMLAKLSTANFMEKILGTAKGRAKKDLPKDKAKQAEQDPSTYFDSFDQSNPDPTDVEMEEMMNAMSQAANQAAEESENMAAAMAAFTHLGIPLLELGDPDEIREMASNKIILSMSKILKKLSSSGGGKNTVKPSPVRGIPVGIKNMQSWSEIPDILPSETLQEDLLSYKIASRSIAVRERHTSMSDYVVYLDKSGSMGSYMDYDGESVPKISFACACVLAMAVQLSKGGGKLTLIPFEADVHDPISKLAEVVKTAMTLTDGGGTDISKMLRDSFKYRDEKVVMVTDGIDSIDDSLAKQAGQEGVSAVLIQTHSPVIEKNMHTSYIEKFKGNFLVEA